MSRNTASVIEGPMPGPAPPAAGEGTRELALAMLDALDAQIAALDERGVIVATNASWERFAAENGGGATAGDDYLRVCDAAAPDASAQAAAQGIRAVLRGERERFELEYPCHAPDEQRWFLLRAVRHRAPGHVRVVVQHDDITVRRVAEDEARLRTSLLDMVDAAVIATDGAGRVTYWSKGAQRLYGWSAAETVGGLIMDVWQDAADREVTTSIMAGVSDSGRWEGRFEARRKDGSSFAVLLRIVAQHDDDGSRRGDVGVAVDVSDGDRVERELRSARNFSRAVTDSMCEGVFTLDVDGLPVYMNPAAESMLGWGHDDVAGRPLHELIHGRGPDGSVLPSTECSTLRAGGDGEVLRVEEDAFSRRDGTMFPVSYTAAPFETADGVRGSAYVFTDITERKADRERLEHELESLSWVPRIREALDEERFALHAQPIVDLATGDTVQHELLIRMNDRDGLLVPPGLFLPAAEEHGLITEIDRWVVGQAAEIAGRGDAIELNVSAESLAEPGLLDVVVRELARTGADPRLMVFELTETALLRSEQTAEAFIHGVKALGCGVALDDFGTGYGGFTYLKRFRVDYLKIDIEFVRDLPRDAASQHVARAVVALAKGFGQKTIAEGVEDAETLEMLRAFGVDYAQGYFLGRPAPLSAMAGRAVV